MKYFSMFSGIGGFEYGIEQASSNRGLLQESTTESNGGLPNTTGRHAGATCIGYSEIDKYASAVYRYHYPDHRAFGDATAINVSDLPDFDLLVGGFPCQTFSIAGKRKGFDESRGTLFFEIARILKHKRPRHFILENVKGLLSHDDGKTFATILGVLSDIGYEYQWQVLNSKDFGVPQNRERVFIVGHLRGERRPEVFPIGESDVGINEGPEQATVNTLSAGGHSGGHHSSMTLIQPVITLNRPEKRQNGRRFKEDGEPRFTLTGQDQHGVMISRPHGFNKGGEKELPCMRGSSMENNDFLKTGSSIRRLTPIECEFLQSFTKNHTKYGVTNYANAKKENAIEILQALRKEIRKEKVKKWEIGKYIALLKKEILRQAVHESRLQVQVEANGVATTRKLPCQTIGFLEILLCVWKREKSRYTPHGQKQIKQLLRELEGLVPKLPYETTQERGWVEHRVSQKQEAEFNGAVYSIVEISDTQRYKCCGNAVTTNVVQAVMERLITTEGERK